MKLSVVYKSSVPASASPYRFSMSAKRSPGQTHSSMPSAFASCRCAHYELTLTICCTLPAGGHNIPRSLWPTSLNPRCSIMFAINSISNRSPHLRL